MKLIFKKEGEDIKIEMDAGTITENFDYVKMIQRLIDRNELDDPEFDGEISDDEQARIKAMLFKIQEAISTDEDPKAEESVDGADDELFGEEDLPF
jgi:hypothetical protein